MKCIGGVGLASSMNGFDFGVLCFWIYELFRFFSVTSQSFKLAVQTTRLLWRPSLVRNAITLLPAPLTTWPRS